MKTIFLITARLKSTRLKKKILKKVNNQPIIKYMIERLRCIEDLDDIVVCTSIDKKDNELVKFCVKNNYKYYRGSKDDVISRLYQAAKKYNAKYVINIPADNPLVDPIYVNKTIKLLKKNKYDLVRNYSIPLGLFCYGMTKRAMRKVCNIKKNNETEVWYRYFTHTKLFKVKTIRSSKKHRFSCRLTMDYIEDFKLIEKIIRYFKYSYFININHIRKYFRLFPKDKNINIKHNKQSTKRFNYQSNLKLKENIKYKKVVKNVYKDFTEFY